jgi:uncharacterized membrane protein YuzA (DUF378 family)
MYAISGMKGVHSITFILLLIGGLNWLLVAVMGNDLGSLVLGGMQSPLSRLVYFLVGIAAVFELATHKGRCKECRSSSVGSV